MTVPAPPAPSSAAPSSAAPSSPPERPDRVVPTWTDPAATQASEAFGGPWGRHAVTGRARFWTPLRVCLLFTTLVLALAWLKQSPCADGNWSGSKQYTHFCYSDEVPLFSVYGLDKGAVPYLDARVEYPVLTGAFIEGAAVLGRTYDSVTSGSTVLPHAPPVESYTVLTCLLLSLCAFVVTRTVLGLSGRRPWDAAMVALSPVLLVYAFNNWDLLAVALSTLGMLAWARRWPVAAGVLLGLAVAAKFYPLLILGALFLLCVRAGQLRTWTRTAVAATLAWLVVDVPIAILAPANWAWFFVFSQQRPANPETVWNILIYLSNGRAFDGPLAPGQAPTVLNAVITALLVVFGLLVGWLVFRAPVRPRVAQVSFLLVAGFLELNKVWSPQYALWLLPLAVLARPKWRSLLLWQLSAALVWMMTMLDYLGTANRGIGVQWFYASALVRDVVVLALMALVVRDVLQPDQDVVRTSWPGVDDPAGGVLDGAPDRVTAARTPAQ